MNNAGQ